MPRRYAVSIAGQTNTAGKVLWDILATATVRPTLYDLIIGSHATPADNSCQYEVYLAADAGTTPTASVTPKALDATDPAATASSHKGIYSVDPAVSGGALLEIPLNLRCTFRWIATPGGELIASAATTSGFLFKSIAVSGSAYTVDTVAHYWE
jgi:hypothetical protein